MEAIGPSGLALGATGCAWSIDAWARRIGHAATPEMFEPYTWAQAELGRRLSAPAYLTALQDVQKMSRDMARFFGDYDIWLTPTLAEPPPPLGTFDAPPEDPLAPLLRTARFMPFTPVCNATGQPAASVPLFWNSEGLPIGTQFVGRFGDEATLFRLAAQLEEARPWTQRWPPLCA